MPNKIDQLRYALATAIGIEKLPILLDLSRSLQRLDPSQAIEYATQALEQAKLYGNDTHRANALFTIAASHFYQGNYETSIHFTYQAAEVYKQLSDEFGRAKALNHLGNNYLYLRHYEKALEFYKAALKLKEQIKDSKSISLTYNNIGLVYRNLGQYANALDYHLKALRIEEKLGETTQISTSLNNIGLIYKNLRQYEKALNYLNRALALKRELNDKKGIAGLLNNLGNIYEHTGQPQLALDYYRQALDMIDPPKDRVGYSITLGNLGKVLSSLGDYESSIRYFRQGLELDETLHDKKGIASSRISIGINYIHLAQLDDAERELRQGLEMAQSIGAKDIIKDAYLALSDLYAARHEYQTALDYHRQYAKIKDELFDDQVTERIAELRTRYETEKKEREAEIYRLKNVELAQAKVAAEAASKAKSEFLAVVSHEIRTPLNGVLGMAQLLEETPLNDEQHEMVSAIMESGNILVELISDILDLSSIDSGKIGIESKPFSIEEALTSTCMGYRDQIEEKGLVFEVTLPENVPDQVWGDAARIQKILKHLLSNAVKFTNAGFIKVVATGQVVSPECYQLSVAVQDSGIGIEPALQNQLFDAFSQGDSSITRRYGGLGIGLAIVKRLVDLMKGELHLESTPGHGTTFTVTLPLFIPPAEPDPRPNTLNSTKVLVVDDNRVIQKLFQRMLESLHCRVDIVDNGQKALDKITTNQYDVVLMDVQMPGMDGIEVTQHIIQRLGKKRPKIIAVSATLLPANRHELLTAGVDDLLEKPVRSDMLKTVIDKWTKV